MIKGSWALKQRQCELLWTLWFDKIVYLTLLYYLLSTTFYSFLAQRLIFVYNFADWSQSRDGSGPWSFLVFGKTKSGTAWMTKAQCISSMYSSQIFLLFCLFLNPGLTQLYLKFKSSQRATCLDRYNLNDLKNSLTLDSGKLLKILHVLC